MNRRAFLTGLGAVLVTSVRVHGQERRSKGEARVGFLGIGSQAHYAANGMASLVPSALRELGWVEGRNITFQWRFADGESATLTQHAAELIGLRVNAIITASNLEAEAARHATRSIPIVVYTALDPVATGLVQSLARPGGNITGVMWADVGVAAKMVDLMADAVPRARRLAILYDATVPGMEAYAEADEAVARVRGIKIVRARVSSREDVTRVLVTMRDHGADALKVAGAGVVGAETPRILEFAKVHRLPTIFTWPAPVERGGLMSYSPDLHHVSARVAALVDKVLKGAEPADLPFEHPSRFQIVINLKSARALGLTIPASLLLRADQVIE